MTESIRRQLVVPPYVSAIHMALGLGMLAGGIALVASSSAEPVVAVAPELELPATAPPAAPARVAAGAPERAVDIAPGIDSLQLVFRAGNETYVRLADIDREGTGAHAWPRHGAPKLVHDGGEGGIPSEVALAPVAEADLAAVHRAWAGKQVIVDGSCRATVTGFVVASRLVGDPAYAGLEKTAWDAASVMKTGTPMIAAKLDRCRGTFARAASLPPVVIPATVKDDQLAATAQSALMASAAGKATQRAWTEAKSEGAPASVWDVADVTSRVLRHPGTGATFVAVHGHVEQECGGPTVNVWGVYRAMPDGTVAPVAVSQLDTLHSIDQIIDVEGDGKLELIGRTWLGNNVVLADWSGAELDQLGMEFYGCPC